MRIEYYTNGKIAIVSGEHRIESSSPLMKNIARLLQESGSNVSPGGQTMCCQTILFEHYIDLDPNLVKTLPVEEDDEEDDIQIVYVDEPPARDELPVHLL